MTRPVQRHWLRREDKDAEQPSESAGEVEGADVPTKRIAAYTPAQSRGTSRNVQADSRHEGTGGSQPSRSTGEQVDAILQTARDTAAKLTAAATEEAERTRAEANAAAIREVETARRRAERDREQAAKERADAEAYAARLRSEAEAAAEKLRADAEHEASTLLESARESARARVVALQAEAKRHEERLEVLLAVSRGMTSEIEDVLEREDGPGLDVEPVDPERAVEPAQEDIGEALRPNTSTEPVA
jgi:chromosome segregation ATPase